MKININKENFSMKVTVAVTYVLMIILNALANIIPINGITSGGVSDFYENLFAPAGITFSIWGVIYLLLLLYVVYQFGIFQKEANPIREDLFSEIGILFAYHLY